MQFCDPIPTAATQREFHQSGLTLLPLRRSNLRTDFWEERVAMVQWYANCVNLNIPRQYSIKRDSTCANVFCLGNTHVY